MSYTVVTHNFILSFKFSLYSGFLCILYKAFHASLCSKFLDTFSQAFPAGSVLKSFESCMGHCKIVSTTCWMAGCLANSLSQIYLMLIFLSPTKSFWYTNRSVSITSWLYSTIFRTFTRTKTVWLLEHTGITKEIFAMKRNW